MGVPSLDDLRSTDRDRQNAAYYAAMDETAKPVEWAYEIWDDLLAMLRDNDNHTRAIAAQLLCNLAKSDPEKRMLNDFDAVVAVTKDDRFVTARHALQALWIVGAAGKPQRQMYLDRMEKRFAECIHEKNWTLIRFDILEGMRNLYDEVRDPAIRAKALELIATEKDDKYRKKYAGVWRGA